MTLQIPHDAAHAWRFHNSSSDYDCKFRLLLYRTISKIEFFCMNLKPTPRFDLQPGNQVEMEVTNYELTSGGKMTNLTSSRRTGTIEKILSHIEKDGRLSLFLEIRWPNDRFSDLCSIYTLIRKV